jgi:hypothetical protein
MDIAEMTIDSVMDEILTVDDFMKEYGCSYPTINEEQFVKQLEHMDKMLIC